MDHHRQQQEANLTRLRQLLRQMGDVHADTATLGLALRSAVVAVLQDEDDFIQRWHSWRATRHVPGAQSFEHAYTNAEPNAVDPLMIDPDELLRQLEHTEAGHVAAPPPPPLPPPPPVSTEAPRAPARLRGAMELHQHKASPSLDDWAANWRAATMGEGKCSAATT
eukprot:jgi/Chlat1/2031/Chrsp159S02328